MQARNEKPPGFQAKPRPINPGVRLNLIDRASPFAPEPSTSSFGRQTLIGYGWACFPITIVPAEPTRELASSRRASPEGVPSLVANIEMS
jgi:hypothetical protein